MLGYVRGYWAIENKLHWSLDVSFREDESRIRIGHAAEHVSRIRRLALNLLRQDKSTKVGVKAERLKACLEEDYLLKLLGQKIVMRLPWELQATTLKYGGPFRSLESGIADRFREIVAKAGIPDVPSTTYAEPTVRTWLVSVSTS